VGDNNINPNPNVNPIANPNPDHLQICTFAECAFYQCLANSNPDTTFANLLFTSARLT